MHTRLRFPPSSALLLSPPYFSVHQRFPFFSSGFYLFIHLFYFFLWATRLAAFSLSLTKCQSIIGASCLSHSFSPPFFALYLLSMLPHTLSITPPNKRLSLLQSLVTDPSVSPRFGLADAPKIKKHFTVYILHIRIQQSMHFSTEAWRCMTVAMLQMIIFLFLFWTLEVLSDEGRRHPWWISYNSLIFLFFFFLFGISFPACSLKPVPSFPPSNYMM